jgi:hypothetical protein
MTKSDLGCWVSSFKFTKFKKGVEEPYNTPCDIAMSN